MNRRYLTINEAGALYRVKASSRIHTHAVDHPDLQSWGRHFRHLKAELGESRSEDIWHRVISRLNWTHYTMLIAPLPFNSPMVISTQIQETLRDQVRSCIVAYPSYANALTQLVNDLGSLTVRVENPLLDALRRLGNQVVLQRQHSALVIRDPRLVREVERFVGSIYPIDIVTPTQLRDKETFETLVFFGPLTWFPEYVRAAPRAFHLHQIAYRWLSKRVDDPAGFVEPIQPPQVAAVTARDDKHEEALPKQYDDDFSLDDILPERLQISLFMQRTNPVYSGRQFREGECPAQVVWLESGEGVFLNTAEGAKVTALDIDEDDYELIRRIPVADLTPGDFILIRTAGGGDLIEPIADRLMGERAITNRKCQRKWKDGLSEVLRVKHHEDIFSLCVTLLDCGAVSVTEGKVRHWLTPSAICPRDRSDLLAIMRLIGAEEETDDCWSRMHEIDNAHRQAGFRIREILLERVRRSDLRELGRLGTMAFDLGEQEGGGSLTAFRVNGIDPTEISIPYSVIGRPLSIEDIEKLLSDSSVCAGVYT